MIIARGGKPNLREEARDVSTWPEPAAKSGSGVLSPCCRKVPQPQECPLGVRPLATRVLFLGGTVLLSVAGGCQPSDDPAQEHSAPSVSAAELPETHSDVTAPAPVEAKEDLFTDMTSRAKISFTYSNGRTAGEYAILESLGGGVAAFDYDLDGHLDLLFAGGGKLDNKTVTANSCALYRNVGDWEYVETTDEAGTSADEFYNHGVYPADYDNDGFADLAVSGYGGLQLFRNQGDGTFEHRYTLVTHPTNPWSTSLAWGDFNGDGNLDLYVTHYVDWSWENHPICPGPRGVPREVCAPRVFPGLSDSIYVNDGQGGFERVTHEVGLVEGGKGLGVVAGDTNGDGHIDIYVTNDTTDNFLYINDGSGHFTESAIIAGVSGDDVGVNMGSMGAVLADADDDGLPDIWVTNFERELFALYLNQGGDLFAHSSRGAGIAAFEGLYVGFGTVMVDLDHDGDRDIVTANGHVSYHSPGAAYQQIPLLLKNMGEARFERWKPGGYFATAHTGRGLAYADLNNDGSWDLVVSHAEEPVALLRGPEPPHSLWAYVRLVGRASNRDAIGATLSMSTGEGIQFHMRNGGGSYLSHSDARIRLRIPAASPDAAVQRALAVR